MYELPLIIDPWLLFRSGKLIAGKVSFDKMPGILDIHNGSSGFSKAEIEIYKREDNDFILKGNANCCLKLTCQRCLDDFDYDLSVNFELLLLKKEPISIDMYTEDYIVCGETLDLAQVIEQELILGLPIIVSHNSCNNDYQKLEKNEPKEQNPFSNLKKILK